MKVVRYYKYGSPDVLQIEEAEKPQCGPGQVLVKTKAISVNPVDYKVRSGQLSLFTGRKFPKVPGADFSGEIAETGSGVNDFKEGEAVFGIVTAFKGGAHAGYVQANPKTLAVKPESITFEEAAALPVAALTALQSLRDQGKISNDSRVLINGSSGGVGHYAIQIAKVFEAHITAVCSTRNIDFSKELGADVVIDYTKESPLNPDEEYDIFFDVVSNTTFSKVKPVLSEKGVYIATLPTPAKMLQMVFTSLFGGRTAKLSVVKSARKDLDFLIDLMTNGKLKSVISKSYTLSDIRQAHTDMESGHTKGKIVLTF